MLPETLEQLKQQTNEAILSNERLTDNLNDDTANTLLNWGTTQIDTLLQYLHNKSLPSIEFQEQLDTSTRSLRRVMRRTNKLVGKIARLSKDEVEKNLSKLMALSQELYPPDLFSIQISPTLTNRAISRLASIAPHLGEEELVKQLIFFLNRFVPTQSPIPEPEQTEKVETPSLSQPEQTEKVETPPLPILEQFEKVGPPPPPPISAPFSQINHFEEAVEIIADSIDDELQSDDSKTETTESNFEIF